MTPIRYRSGLLAVVTLACLGWLTLLARRPAHAVSAVPAIIPAPIAIKVVVVANFEKGADMGDAPGEYQDWVEREHLNEIVSVRGAANILRRNREGLYGLIPRQGAADFSAFVLDPHFDLRKTYWVFTGISGVDPKAGTVGDAAWARWVINGDELHEVDDRELPAGWPYGLWAIGANRPNELPVKDVNGKKLIAVTHRAMAYDLNQGLARWAFHMTKDVPLGENRNLLGLPRERWNGFPEAQREPKVMMGETLGCVRYWHGASRTRWAEDWTRLWTGGKGTFVMTNMESQTYERLALTFAGNGLLDKNSHHGSAHGKTSLTPLPGKTSRTRPAMNPARCSLSTATSGPAFLSFTSCSPSGRSTKIASLPRRKARFTAAALEPL
jgi:purine nucleoside permease